MARELSQSDDGKYSVRELLAMLRGASDAVLRVRALQTLAAVGGTDLSAGLRIAMADSEYVVRLTALKIGWQVASDRLAWARRGLDDPAPAVRGKAAEYAGELPRSVSIPLLLSVLDSENDGYVFEKMHNVFIGLAGDRASAPSGRGLDEAGREQVRVFWRRHWDR